MTKHSNIELPCGDSEIDSFLKKNKKRVDTAFIEQHLDRFTSAHWATISQHIMLTEDFLIRHKNLVNWKKAFKHQRYSAELIEQKLYAGRPIWKSILTNKLLDESLIEKYWLEKKMPWKFKSDQNWAIFSARQFSRDFIERHPERLSTFMYTQKLDQDYIQDRYWLIVANCNKYSTSYGCNELYEDWTEFRKKQRHLPNSFFDQFERKSAEDAYRVLDASTVQAVGVDKVDWGCVGCFSRLTSELLAAFRGHIPPALLEGRLKFRADAPARAQELLGRHAQDGANEDHLVEINNFLNECHVEGLVDLAIGLYESVQDTSHLNPYIFHNTACLYVDQGAYAKAIAEVDKACQYSYEHLDRLFEDPDLAPISSDPTFLRLKQEHESQDSDADEILEEASDSESNHDDTGRT